MTEPIYKTIPDPETLLALEPEELAGLILEYLNSPRYGTDANPLRLGNFLSLNVTNYPREGGYPHQYQERIREALTEAWVFLESQGLIAPKPEQGAGWVFITRRGQRLKSPTDFDNYRKAALLPKQLLHPVIFQKVYFDFLRGDYDSAAFKAFKEVEVAVRKVGGFALKDYGIELMRQAFKPVTGPLTDADVPLGEQESLAHLFAGSIGLFKNPHSHRHEPIEDPAEAVELIMLASHLLRIVDSRMTKESVSLKEE